MDPNSDPLAQLRDIHLPEEIGIWPLSFGWWILIALSALTIILLSIWLFKRWRYLAPKRQAISELQNIKQDQPNWHIELNSLLKRTALSYFQQSEVASLHTQNWVTFLASQLAESKQQEFCRVMNTLQSSLYSEAVSSDFSSCYAQTLIWLKHGIPAANRTKTAKTNLARVEAEYV